MFDSIHLTGRQHFVETWADFLLMQTCISTLAIRNMVRPFKEGMLEQACPMADILGEVASQLDELKVLRRQADFEMAPS